MFFVSGIDGSNTIYDPIEFRESRDIARLHPKSASQALSEDAVEFEPSIALDTTSLVYSRLSQVPAEVELVESVVEEEDGSGSVATSEPNVAKEIMSSPVVTLSSSSTLAEAAKVFREYRYRYLPVTDEDDALVGIVSDRDFLRASTESAEAARSNQQVADIMVRNVLNARPQAEIMAVAQVLFKERIGAMPIVNNEGKLSGMVTRSDIQRAYLGLKVHPLSSLTRETKR